MKRSVLYAAAMMAVTGVMMWHNPMISHAEPVQEEAVQISEVLLVPSEEEVLAQSGPDAEIQKALAEAKAAEEAAAQAAEEAEAEQNARQSLVDYALQFVGGAYKAGGSDPHTGADGSGFVKYVMQYGAGISMNRSSTSQSTQGQAIDASQMQPGDLIFYGNGSRINHVAMYIGDGQIVHASTYKTGIKTSEWDYRDPVKIITMF